MAGAAGLFVAALLTPAGPARFAAPFSRATALESNLQVLSLPLDTAAHLFIWLGRQDYSSLRSSPRRGRHASPRRSLALPRSSRTLTVLILPLDTAAHLFIWLGRQDSNLRMRGSKPRALPLGDATIKNSDYMSDTCSGDLYSPRATNAVHTCGTSAAIARSYETATKAAKTKAP